MSNEPPKTLSRVIEEGMIQGAEQLSEKLGNIWREEANRKAAMILEATKNKTHIPDNFWQTEFRARQAYNSSIRLLRALKGDPS